MVVASSTRRVLWTGVPSAPRTIRKADPVEGQPCERRSVLRVHRTSPSTTGDCRAVWVDQVGDGGSVVVSLEGEGDRPVASDRPRGVGGRHRRRPPPGPWRARGQGRPAATRPVAAGRPKPARPALSERQETAEDQPRTVLLRWPLERWRRHPRAPGPRTGRGRRRAELRSSRGHAWSMSVRSRSRRRARRLRTPEADMPVWRAISVESKPATNRNARSRRSSGLRCARAR